MSQHQVYIEKNAKKRVFLNCYFLSNPIDLWAFRVSESESNIRPSIWGFYTKICKIGNYTILHMDILLQLEEVEISVQKPQVMVRTDYVFLRYYVVCTMANIEVVGKWPILAL